MVSVLMLGVGVAVCGGGGVGGLVGGSGNPGVGAMCDGCRWARDGYWVCVLICSSCAMVLLVALFMAGFVGRLGGFGGWGARVNSVDTVEVELCEADGEIDKSFNLYVIKCGIIDLCMWPGWARRMCFRGGSSIMSCLVSRTSALCRRGSPLVCELGVP